MALLVLDPANASADVDSRVSTAFHGPPNQVDTPQLAVAAVSVTAVCVIHPGRSGNGLLPYCGCDAGIFRYPVPSTHAIVPRDKLPPTSVAARDATESDVSVETSFILTSHTSVESDPLAP